MQVMAEEGLLLRNKRHRSRVYESRFPKEQTRQQLASNLVHRAFNGSAKSVVLGALIAASVLFQVSGDPADAGRLREGIEMTRPLVHYVSWNLLHLLWEGAVLALLLTSTLRLLSNRLSQLRYTAACCGLDPPSKSRALRMTIQRS
jgi:hypothetical protein